jgi:regulator of protease activity HflC (stomatin/prohibitin superfamily)
MAVQLEDGEIKSIQGPGGRYSGGWFETLVTVDIDTITFSVEDPEVLTSDNQAVGMRITIQARRKSDTESITNIVTNWYALTNNDQLKETISATAREGLKNGVRGFTLSELLNDRNGLGNAIREQLETDAAKYSVEIINVTVENVAPSAEYMKILSDKANLTAETAKELERQKLIAQQAANNILQAEKDVEVKEAQLLAEQAKTAVEVEIAKREGEKTAAAQEVYSLNAQAYELERLRLMALIYGDKTMFISPGTNLFINPGNIIPIQ